jgi:hypothetical protein
VSFLLGILGWRSLAGKAAILAAAILSGIMFAMQATSPPDIAGKWQGDEWGQVVLAQTASDEYTGTYSDTVAKEKGPGKINLKWSRIERRFNGTWSEGEDRFGKLSARLMGKEIHGALAIDRKSKINPGTPRLADLMWTRAGPPTSGDKPSAERGEAVGDGKAPAMLLFLGLCPVFGITVLGCILIVRWATRAANRPVGGSDAADVKRPEAKESVADPSARHASDIASDDAAIEEERRQVKGPALVSALPAPYAAPRLSKTALVGAVWGGPLFAIIILSLYVITLWLTLSTNALFPLLSPILILLLATPIGVPIVGYVALSQIRHSAGRLYGLGLALFDLLAFPLLALDAVIAGLGIFAARVSASHWSAAGTLGDLALVVAVLLIVGACVVIDFLTIRWVWRAVNQPPAGGLPADRSKRAGLKTMLLVAAPVAAFLLGFFGFAFLLWSLTEGFESATARIHTRIFEADAKLVDELVPGPTRNPGQMQVRIATGRSAPQTALVSADVFARLLADGAKEPGLLDDQTWEGTWWPKRATSSHYMRHGKVNGSGNIEGFLGLWRYKDVLRLRVEENVLHGMNSIYLGATFAWEGSSPPSGAARAFFIPFSRQDGTARYLVIAFEVGKAT